MDVIARPSGSGSITSANAEVARSLNLRAHMKTARDIHGFAASIPAIDRHLIHIQFRRFASCPICNLHLQSFIGRYLEISGAGIKGVVVFHSSDTELLLWQGQFRFDVTGDPQKKLYRSCSVETSVSAILSPAVWPAILKGNLAKNKPAKTSSPVGGRLGLPAEFLIAPDGVVRAAHYGRRAYDQWSVDEGLALARA